MTSNYTIGQLANAVAVNVEAIRYYERRGLITQPPRPAQGFRTYPETTLTRILFIKRAQELAEAKLVSVRGKINDLCRLERVLCW